MNIWGTECAPIFFFLAETLPKAALPECEGNATEGGCMASIYTNTVLDVSVILCVCSCAIETPSRCPILKLSTCLESSYLCGSYKTKWGAGGAPNLFF